MAKRAFDKIAAGLNDAIDIVEGRADPGSFRIHVPQDVDVKSIRQHMGLSQTAFAAKYGFPAATVRDWEQGRRRPEASARILLRIIERRPDAVEDALGAP